MNTLVVAFVLLLPSLQAQEESVRQINPALLYWQVAAQLPQLSSEQAKTLSELATGRAPYDAVKAQALGFGSSEILLRKAANSAAACDWGLAIEEGPSTVMPHLSKMMELGRMAVLKVEGALAQGKTEEAQDWLLMTHRLARHAGASEFLISYLVQTAIEAMATGAAARHCLSWDLAARHSYAAKLKALPPLHSLQESYHGEVRISNWFERTSKLAEPQRAEKLRAVLGESGTGDKGQQEELMRVVLDPEKLGKELTALREFHRRVETALAKPWKEAAQELDRIESDLKRSEFVLMKTLHSAVRSVFEQSFVIVTKRTMLEAALEHGAQLDEASAASFRDAFEGQPLRVSKSADGTLRLVAAEQHPKGKDIELKLGK